VVPRSRSLYGEYRWLDPHSKIAAAPKKLVDLLKAPKQERPRTEYQNRPADAAAVRSTKDFLTKWLDNLRWRADGIRGKALCPNHGGESERNMEILILPDGWPLLCDFGTAHCTQAEIMEAINQRRRDAQKDGGRERD